MIIFKTTNMLEVKRTLKRVNVNTFRFILLPKLIEIRYNGKKLNLKKDFSKNRIIFFKLYSDFDKVEIKKIKKSKRATIKYKNKYEEIKIVVEFIKKRKTNYTEYEKYFSNFVRDLISLVCENIYENRNQYKLKYTNKLKKETSKINQYICLMKIFSYLFCKNRIYYKNVSYIISLKKIKYEDDYETIILSLN